MGSFLLSFRPRSGWLTQFGVAVTRLARVVEDMLPGHGVEAGEDIGGEVLGLVRFVKLGDPV